MKFSTTPLSRVFGLPPPDPAFGFAESVVDMDSDTLKLAEHSIESAGIDEAVRRHSTFRKQLSRCKEPQTATESHGFKITVPVQIHLRQQLRVASIDSVCESRSIFGMKPSVNKGLWSLHSVPPIPCMNREHEVLCEPHPENMLFAKVLHCFCRLFCARRQSS